MLDRGLNDFGVLLNPVDGTKYEALDLPDQNIWGVIMRTDASLATQARIVWKKKQVFSRAASLFLRELRTQLEQYQDVN